MLAHPNEGSPLRPVLTIDPLLPALEAADVTECHTFGEIADAVVRERWSVISGQWQVQNEGPTPEGADISSQQKQSRGLVHREQMLENARKRPLSATVRAARRAFGVPWFDPQIVF
jgi:hypothetical protein